MFVKETAYVFPMFNYAEGLKIRISKALLLVHEEILDWTWTEMDYRKDMNRFAKEAQLQHLRTNI